MERARRSSSVVDLGIFVGDLILWNSRASGVTATVTEIFPSEAYHSSRCLPSGTESARGTACFLTHCRRTRAWSPSRRSESSPLPLARAPLPWSRPPHSSYGYDRPRVYCDRFPSHCARLFSQPAACPCPPSCLFSLWQLRARRLLVCPWLLLSSGPDGRPSADPGRPGGLRSLASWLRAHRTESGTGRELATETETS